MKEIYHQTKEEVKKSFHFKKVLVSIEHIKLGLLPASILSFIEYSINLDNNFIIRNDLLCKLFCIKERQLGNYLALLEDKGYIIRYCSKKSTLNGVKTDRKIKLTYQINKNIKEHETFTLYFDLLRAYKLTTIEWYLLSGVVDNSINGQHFRFTNEQISEFLNCTHGYVSVAINKIKKRKSDILKIEKINRVRYLTPSKNLNLIFLKNI